MENKKESGLATAITAYLITGFLVFSCFFNFLVRYGLPKIALLSNGRVLSVFLHEESKDSQDEVVEAENGETICQDFDSENGINWEERYPFTEEERINRSEILKVAEDEDEKNQIFFGYYFLHDGEESPFWKWGDRYYSMVSGIEGKIQYYFLYNDDKDRMMFMLNKKLERIAGTGISADGCNEAVIKMENGFLTFMENMNSTETTEKIADRVGSFGDFLKDNDIPFLYALAGDKVCPIDRQGTEGMEFTNENADSLIEELKKRGIDILDYRKEMLDSGLDYYSSYYKYDHHWKTTTGLWASQVLAEKLNKNYGFNFDPYYYKKDNYNIIKYNSFWLGSQGRRVGFYMAGLEDFEVLLPKYDTDFSLEIPSENRIYSGNYEKTLLDMKILEKIAGYTKEEHLSKIDAYHLSRLKNQPLVNITNNKKNNNGGKRILIIQDSFSRYLSTYIAADISYIDIIYPRDFDGNIREYIRRTNPDIVIMILCSRNIKPDMFCSI